MYVLCLLSLIRHEKTFRTLSHRNFFFSYYERNVETDILYENKRFITGKGVSDTTYRHNCKTSSHFSKLDHRTQGGNDRHMKSQE